jgi:hypothetical protein
MKPYFLMLSIIILVFICPLKANACSCAPTSSCQSFGSSSAVFIGQVIEGSEQVKMERQTDNSVTYVAGIIRFAVEESFKGALGPEVKISVNGNIDTSCGPYGLIQGEKYLIYAYGDSRNLRAGVCSRTTGLANAVEDLQFLRSLPPPGSGGSLYGNIWTEKGERETTPLSGVTVLVQDSENQPVKAVTDGQGKFELTNLKAGKYTVQPVFPEYL